MREETGTVSLLSFFTETSSPPVIPPMPMQAFTIPKTTLFPELLDKIIGDNTFSYVSREKKFIAAMVSMIYKIPVLFFKK